MTSLITAADIVDWNSLDDISSTLEKRGLKPRQNLGNENRLVLQLDDDEFIELIQARPGDSVSDYQPEDAYRRHTNLVATSDFEEFTFITRVRTFDQSHGQIKHQKFSFTKSQFKSDTGEKHSVLEKLNDIEYGKPATIFDDLYDTRKIVKEFYEQFEELRTELVQQVHGIPDDAGDAKQRYVQVILDRMIFLYFIQEKRLLDRNVDYLHDHHQRVLAEDGDEYEDFYQPLFFDLLSRGTRDPDFGNLPFLNGGLFTRNEVEVEHEEVRLGENAEETNAIFGDILDFLSDWNWNVDERLDIVDPKNLSPEILGHIFEQTVNQKEMGAYYTPEEITGFMARRSVHPYLLDQLNEAVDSEYEEIDEVFALDEAHVEPARVAADGGALTQQARTDQVRTEHVDTLYFDILKETRILDPAVGSGAFLLACQDVLVDIYLQCLEFFEQLEAEGEAWKLSDRARGELESVQAKQSTKTLYAKREIILNNLYGVDIDAGAVEICKLRLWLSMVADIEDEPSEVDPLPNIDFNIRQGNSLIGFTDLKEMATEDGDESLVNYDIGIEDRVADLYGDIITAIHEHQESESSQKAAASRRTAEAKIREHSAALDEKVLHQFHNAGIEDITIQQLERYDPFHWVLEFASVYRDGGFDIVIGNPPWDQVQANPDEFFVEYDPVFPSRESKDKEHQQEQLLRNPEVAKSWEEYEQTIQRTASYYKYQFELQQPVVDGTKQPIPNDLSALFLERSFDLVSDEGYVAQILPNVVFSGAMGKDLRVRLLDETTVDSLVIFENKGIFDGVDDRYKFGILTFQNSGRTDSLTGIGMQHDVRILRNFDKHALHIPREILTKYSPEARSFPNIRSDNEINVLEKIIQHPPIKDNIGDKWYAEIYYELRKGYDNDRYTQDEQIGDYPIYEGKNYYQFTHDERFFNDIDPVSYWSVEEDGDDVKSAKTRVKEKNLPNLKRELYTKFNGSGSQKQFVNDLLEQRRGRGLDIDDVKLDGSEYRLVYRKISNPTNERTVIGTVLPPGIVTLDSVYTLRPFEFDIDDEDLEGYPLHSVYKRIFEDRELFAALGLINSIPFDFLMRTKDAQNLLAFRFGESQVPRLTEGEDWFRFISQRAARLTCYGEEFEDMRDRLGGVQPIDDLDERRTTQAEIDAAAFHAYGLSQDETKFVLEDFHQVENPRMMDDDYFEVVLKNFQELNETGPHP